MRWNKVDVCLVWVARSPIAYDGLCQANDKLSMRPIIGGSSIAIQAMSSSTSPEYVEVRHTVPRIVDAQQECTISLKNKLNERVYQEE